MARRSAPTESASAERPSDPARRRDILEAAEKLFRHYGPHKTTIGDIAREAGIGVGSVYLEFCSKDDIVAELSGRRHHRVLAAMRQAAGAQRAERRLTAALEARVSALFELKAEGAHSCDLVLCAATKSAYGRFRSEERQFVAELLGEQDVLEVRDVERVAELIEIAYAALSPPWLFELEQRRALALCRELNELLLRGLLVRPATTPIRRRTR